MHQPSIKTLVIVLAVWCIASILTQALKMVQANDSPQSRVMVQEVRMPYTEQDCSECRLLSETSLPVADCNMPRTHPEGRLWSGERSGVELQVPEPLVRALLMGETDGRSADLQVPEALLRILHTEGCRQGP
jgi:hypothetical protein